MKRQISISIMAVALQSGCSTVTSPIAGPLLSDGHTNTSGAHQLFAEQEFEVVNLSAILDPEGRRYRFTPSFGPESPPREPHSATESEQRLDLERAFQAFYTYGPGLEERRSRVQDRMLAASDQRCNTYKNYLRRIETAQQTSTGVLTTIFGGAGAIATHAATVRALSGLAGISSGIGAELRQGYFSNLASQIIVPGMDLARSEMRRDILARRIQPVGVYTVEAALSDVARYHGACSMNAGIERSGMAVNEIVNPGLRALNTSLGQLNLAQRLARRLTDDTVDVTADIRLVGNVSGSAGGLDYGARDVPTRSGSYLERYLSALRLTIGAVNEIEARAKQLVDACRNRSPTTESKCAQSADIAKAISDSSSEGDMTTSHLRKVLGELPKSGYRDELAKKDAEFWTREAGLQQSPGTPGEVAKNRAEFRVSLLQAEGDFTQKLIPLEELYSHIDAARRAAADGRGDALSKALTAAIATAGKLP